MTTIDSSVVGEFRTYFPEFDDETTWPEPKVKRALQNADAETGSSRWNSYQVDPASLKARGLFNYAAHELVMGVMRQKAVEAGKAPAAGSRVQSKQVGDESVGYATPAAQSLAEDARFGSLTATLYGQEFLRLRKRAGTGAATTGQVSL